MRRTGLLAHGTGLALWMAGAVSFATEPEVVDLVLLERAARLAAPDVDISTRKFKTFDYIEGEQAWLETVRKRDLDGAERWKNVLCHRVSAPASWQCSTIDRKTVWVKPSDTGPRLEVEIPLGLSGGAAHRFIYPGLLLIPQTEVRQACDAHESDAVQQLDAVKRAFAQVSGNKLRLSAERGGFALHIDGNAVHFEFDLSRDLNPRIGCWEDGDELE